MQVVARPPFDGTLRYLVRAARPKLTWIRLLPDGRQTSEDTDGPTVVVVDDAGRETVIQRPGTLGQAKRAAARFQRELEKVGQTEFARRYGLRLQ